MKKHFNELFYIEGDTFVPKFAVRIQGIEIKKGVYIPQDGIPILKIARDRDLQVKLDSLYIITGIY